MIVLTVAAANHLAKSMVMAQSFKTFHPEARLYLCLMEREFPPDAKGLSIFEEIIKVGQLGIEYFSAFIFPYSLYEACGAVKPFLIKYLLKQHPDEKYFIYIDADTFVLSRFEEVIQALNAHNIVLTAHILEPEKTPDNIGAWEINALKHGLINAGFFAVNNSSEAKKFMDWWAQRTYWFSFLDYQKGLFLDQKWLDLTFLFFPGIHILRHPGYNVAAWNLSQRPVVTAGKAYNIGSEQMRFFHFSGFHSWGRDQLMFANNSVVRQLSRHYEGELQAFGQSKFQSMSWSYGAYNNGGPILPAHRLLYQNRNLRKRYANPFDAAAPDSFLAYAVSTLRPPGTGSQAEIRLRELEVRLTSLLQSKSWRLTAPLRHLKQYLGKWRHKFKRLIWPK